MIELLYIYQSLSTWKDITYYDFTMTFNLLKTIRINYLNIFSIHTQIIYILYFNVKLCLQMLTNLTCEVLQKNAWKTKPMVRPSTYRHTDTHTHVCVCMWVYRVFWSRDDQQYSHLATFIAECANVPLKIQDSGIWCASLNFKMETRVFTMLWDCLLFNIRHKMWQTKRPPNG